MADFSELTSDLLTDDEVIPPASIILNQLIVDWINEKNAPELLKYASDTVDCMMDQIDQMDENLQILSRDDFRVVPHQMEVNRIRFILASYHRCRLEKIETFAAYLVRKERAASTEDKIMSPGELKFAEEFLSHHKDHFHYEAIRYMPHGLINDEQTTAEVFPNFHSSVFIDMLKPSQSILVNNRREEVELPLGSRHLLPYDDVTNLIKDGSAILI